MIHLNRRDTVNTRTQTRRDTNIDTDATLSGISNKHITSISWTNMTPTGRQDMLHIDITNTTNTRITDFNMNLDGISEEYDEDIDDIDGIHVNRNNMPRITETNFTPYPDDFDDDYRTKTDKIGSPFDENEDDDDEYVLDLNVNDIDIDFDIDDGDSKKNENDIDENEHKEIVHSLENKYVRPTLENIESYKITEKELNQLMIIVGETDHIENDKNIGDINNANNEHKNDESNSDKNDTQDDNDEIDDDDDEIP